MPAPAIAWAALAASVITPVVTALIGQSTPYRPPAPGKWKSYKSKQYNGASPPVAVQAYSKGKKTIRAKKIPAKYKKYNSDGSKRHRKSNVKDGVLF